MHEVRLIGRNDSAEEAGFPAFKRGTMLDLRAGTAVERSVEDD